MRAILPGLAFAVALAIAAKLGSLATGGQVSAILLAILLGIAWRNLAGVGAWAEPGLEFAGLRLLRIGIALIGLRLTLALLAGVSVVAVPVVVACIAVALMAGVGLGRLFGVSPGIRRLLAAGTAICGCTAIIAIAPLVNARRAGHRGLDRLRGAVRVDRDGGVSVDRARTVRHRHGRGCDLLRRLDPGHLAGGRRRADLRAAVRRAGRGRDRRD